jgi:hypothetical protein
MDPAVKPFDPDKMFSLLRSHTQHTSTALVTHTYTGFNLLAPVHTYTQTEGGEACLLFASLPFTPVTLSVVGVPRPAHPQPSDIIRSRFSMFSRFGLATPQPQAQTAQPGQPPDQPGETRDRTGGQTNSCPFLTVAGGLGPLPPLFANPFGPGPQPPTDAPESEGVGSDIPAQAALLMFGVSQLWTGRILNVPL